jgi:gliding motility-associated-like protein
MLKAIVNIIVLCVLSCNVFGQVTFKKFINTTGNVSALRTIDGRHTPDGGYITTGTGTFAGVDKPFIIKSNCKGAFEWGKSFGNNSTWSNIFNKVIVTADSGYLMLNNVGTFQAYNILLVKINKDGSTAWRKIINNGLGNDMGQSVKQTADGGYIICGATSSYGADAGSASYTDAYIIKLTAQGNIAWSKTLGNAATIDDAKDIIQTIDGGYAFIGSYIHQACFQVVLCKLDSVGNVQFVKCYGDTLSRNNGYVIQQTSNGNFLLFASTTLAEPGNFNGDVDHWLINTNANGDTLWSKVFHGSNNDGSDNSLSMCIVNNKIVCGTETMSYPSTGFTPNKQVSYMFDANGQALQVTGYNTTGSQYPRIHPAYDGGYTLCGFTTNFSNVNFRTNIFKLDSNLNSGCTQNNLLSLIKYEAISFNATTPTFTTSSGGTISNSSLEASFTFSDTTLCESYPVIVAGFTTSNYCLGDSVQLTSTASGATSYTYIWQAGDTMVTNNTQVYNTYTSAGTYTITQIASNGCDATIATQVIIINAPPPINIVASDSMPSQGQVVTLSTQPIGSNLLWSTNSQANTIDVSTSGVYWVSAMVNGCQVGDSITINFSTQSDSGYIWFPTAFVPDGVAPNNLLKYYTSNNYSLKSLQVFTRWGLKVFDTKNENEYWDGKYLGTLVDVDTYYILAQFTNTINNKIVYYKGNCVLIK